MRARVHERLTCQRCPQNIAIVCDGGMCDPPSKDVGTWWRGMPAWPIYEWDWLAKQAAAAEEREDERMTGPRK
jgi:hypothetical protein